MTERPTYEELKNRVAELEEQINQSNTATTTNPPDLFSVLMEAFRYIPLCKTFEDAAKAIFEHCKRLTGARSGYVALLSENGEENEVLFLDAGGMPCDVDPNLPMPIRGLREIAYKTKEVAYDNSFPESPWMKYMPEGHVRLDNVLFAPLNIEKKTVGVIGIANKAGGFNEYDVHISKILGDLAAVALSYARSQENLRENEAKLRSMLNASPLAIVLLNRSGCILDCNEEHANRLKVSRDEILGRCLWELLPKEVLSHRKRQVYEVFETGKPLTGEDRRGDIWNLYNIHPAMFDNSGKVQAVIVEAIDITDRKQAQEALEESKSFLDNMSDIAYIADDQGNLTWVNSAVRRMTGFLPEELIGKPFLPLFIEEDHASLMNVYQRTLNGETLENTLTFKTGITCHFTSLPKRNNQGNIIGTFGVARDISEQQAAESALKISETRLKKAQAMAKVGNWEYDIATGKVWGSEEAFHIYGIERTSEFLPLDVVESYIIDAKRVNQALVDLVTQNTPYDIEFQIQTKNRKESIHVHSMAELVYDGDGNPEKVVGVIQDITEPKKAEEILSQKHEMLQNTEAMANIGSWEWDVQSDRAYWSEELFRIFGRNPAGGAPSFAEQSELYGNGDMQRLRDAVENCIKRGTSYEIELRAIRTDGEVRHCISRGKPQYDENGEISRIVGSFQDITERKQAEDSLLRSEKDLRESQRIAHVGSWRLDVATNQVVWTEELYNMYGFDPSLPPPPYTEHMKLFTPESWERLSTALAHTRKTGIPYTLELETVRKDGSNGWMWVRGEADVDSEGKTVELWGAAQDITDRKRVETYHEMGLEILQILNETGDLQKSIQRILAVLKTRTGFDAVGLRLQEGEDFPYFAQDGFPPDFMLTENKLIEHGKDGGACRDKDGNVRLECTCGLVISGKTDPSDPLFTKGGSSWTNDSFPFLDLPSDQDPRLHPRNNCIHQGYASVALIPVRTSDRIVGLIQLNDKRKGRFTLEMIEILEGIAAHIGSALMRKQAEEEIARRELTLNKIFDVLPIGLWFADKNGKLLRGNPAGVKIWGAEPTVPMEEYGVFKARRLPSGEEIAPDDWALAHTIQKGVTVTDELLEIDAFDGQKRIVFNYTAPVVNDSGEMLGAIVVNNDITHHKQAEAEREKLRDQLTQAQKMESVGRLAGGVAHDFNNMLGVILGHVEFALEKAEQDHDLHADLKEIQTAAKRSANLTKQLLTFARKDIISPKKLDLNDTVESMLNMLRRLIGEDIDLVWKPSVHLWSVKMDPSQINQILANLCVNARDAIAGVGKLTIETGRKSFDEQYCSEHPGFIPGDFVLLTVSDNGSGMDKETLDNLFEPFFTTKDVGKGTGFGLATIYGIVKQNNGFINVYSEPGQGSTFNIYLPRLVAGEDIDKTVPEKKAIAGGTETILLVEDEPTILRMTRMMLERKGYSVLSAATPTEAVEKATHHSGPIDMLMTDVVMPEMNGRDLAGKITPLYPDIRLLFMSGYTANVIAHHGVLDDGVLFIQKPFSMADLAEKVREVLDMAPDKN